MRFAWLFGTGAFVDGLMSGGQVMAHGIETQVQSHAKLAAEGYVKLRSGEMPNEAQLHAMGLSEPEARGMLAVFEMDRLEAAAGSYEKNASDGTRSKADVLTENRMQGRLYEQQELLKEGIQSQQVRKSKLYDQTKLREDRICQFWKKKQWMEWLWLRMVRNCDY